MAEGILSMGVRAGAERCQDVQPYPVLDRRTATLTMRECESDPRIPLSLRKDDFAEDEQWWNTGSFVLFARTKAEREARGDPRPSIEERYPSHAAYIEVVTRVCEVRVREGLMLQDDADRLIAAAREKNPLDPSVRLGPLIQAGAYTGR
jgi:hypothetical protein